MGNLSVFLLVLIYRTCILQCFAFTNLYNSVNDVLKKSLKITIYHSGISNYLKDICNLLTYMYEVLLISNCFSQINHLHTRGNHYTGV